MSAHFSEANLKFAAILVTAIVGIAGLLLNLYQIQRNMALEARRPFLEKQLDICFAATDAAASIAAGAPARPESEPPIEVFKRLYLGQLALVEDEGVACAMTRFGRAFNAQLDDKAEPIASGSAVGCPQSVPPLQEAALDLAQACRRLIIQSWGAELPAEVRR